ncbi:hypothetical protein MSAS_10710 [Mycobacterium saskatchewanense]|nr:hypothetical protein MSAS_10710 [Mycobacterium saskatchewanense]
MAGPAIGRTAPAGRCDTGGDCAAFAGSMVGGALESGLDEHAGNTAVAASKANNPAACRLPGGLSAINRDSNYFPSRKRNLKERFRIQYGHVECIKSEWRGMVAS